MKKYKRGYVQGTFDMFHIGHLLLIQRAAARCHHLIVGVVSDEFNMSNKKRLPCIPYEDRAAIVAAIGEVAEVIKVERGQSVIDTWKKHPYDCYFSGDDHVGADFTREMEAHGIDVVFFPYTARVSSTKLREEIIPLQERKKEVLFLPYKAAMWDSMESVWEAAKNDEKCHAVVVPIPYAELNADGSVHMWHCDKDKFPDYVDVTEWESYDLDREKPDVIYIHNPYDDANRLTQVGERFFARNLRKFTNMLVYIPYFAWTGVWPGNHLRLPCYKYMDRMIVQSTRYQVIGDRFFYEDNVSLEDVMPSGKVVALGSPKFDKMLKISKMVELPPRWQIAIGRRKTVFYNTGVSALMIYGERCLEKMWQVYHAMQKYDDLSYIWRPHPLLESMLGSRYPELVEVYEEWKQAVLSLPQVIYDDTPDFERAVALSDAYIGETSSVVQFFAMAGKPIFYNDMLIGAGQAGSEEYLVGSSLVAEGDKIYFWAEYWNALCEMSLRDESVKILYHNEPSDYHVGNYGVIKKIGNHLILPPANAPAILDYDLATGRAVEIRLEHPLEIGNVSVALPYDHKVIMVGGNSRWIFTYDVKTQKIQYLWEAPPDILAMRWEGHETIFGSPCLLDDVLYVPLVNSNHVLALNMLTAEAQIFAVGVEAARYGFATAYAGNIWLAPRLGGPLTVWNPPTGVMQIFDQFPRGFTYENVIYREETAFFSGCVAIDKYWWLLPSQAHNVLRLDMETGNIELVDWELAAENEHYLMPFYSWCGEVIGDDILIWIAKDCKLYRLNGMTKEKIGEYSPRLMREEAAKLRHKLSMADFGSRSSDGRIAAIYEDGINRTIEAFFKYVKEGEHDYVRQKQKFAEMTENIDGTCGKKIHGYIMNQLRDK